MRNLLLVIGLVAALWLTGDKASAQEGGSFLTPFPENDTYRLLVIGDSLADGIVGGIAESLANERGINVNRKHRNLSTLLRAEVEDDMRAIEEQLQKEPAHIVVVMLGVYDRTPVRAANGRRVPVNSPEWREVYGKRVDRLIKVLRGRRAAVYWVGLPVLRRYDWNEDIQIINDVIREKSFLNSVKYIDAYAGFVDETGAYSAYGPDLTGKWRLLREGDGVHFTEAGNRKLAHFVEREVMRDVNQAKSERAVPLLGDEEQQRRINPGTAKKPATAAGAPATAGPGQKGEKGGDPKAGWKTTTQTAPTTTPDASGDVKADNSRIVLRIVGQQGRQESVPVEIVRPPLAGHVIRLLTRRESADKAAHHGETLTDEIAGGAVVMSTVSQPNEAPVAGGRRRLPAQQTAYFRALVKGERLQPRPGRADHQPWPRSDTAEGETGGAPPAAPRVIRRGGSG